MVPLCLQPWRTSPWFSLFETKSCVLQVSWAYDMDSPATKDGVPHGALGASVGARVEGTPVSHPEHQCYTRENMQGWEDAD